VLPGRPTPPTCRFRSSCAAWFKAGRSICLTEAGRRPSLRPGGIWNWLTLKGCESIPLFGGEMDVHGTV
jgi:hypothetical protein